MPKSPRVTMRAALLKIERATRGYYYLSADGMMHAYAAAALKLPLTAEERALLLAEQQRAAEQPQKG